MKKTGGAESVINALLKWICNFIFSFIKQDENEQIDLKEDSQSENESFRHPLIQKKLFSGREGVLLRMLLDLAKENHFLVFAKVKLLDLVETTQDVNRKEQFWQNNRIKELHLDFVLAQEDGEKVLCAIELDDASHNNEKVMKRDWKKNEALRLTGIPLLRIPAGWFKKTEVENLVRSVLVQSEEAVLN